MRLNSAPTQHMESQADQLAVRVQKATKIARSRQNQADELQIDFWSLEIAKVAALHADVIASKMEGLLAHNPRFSNTEKTQAEILSTCARVYDAAADILSQISSLVYKEDIKSLQMLARHTRHIEETVRSENGNDRHVIVRFGEARDAKEVAEQLALLQRQGLGTKRFPLAVHEISEGLLYRTSGAADFEHAERVLEKAAKQLPAGIASASLEAERVRLHLEHLRALQRQMQLAQTEIGRLKPYLLAKELAIAAALGLKSPRFLRVVKLLARATTTLSGQPILRQRRDIALRAAQALEAFARDGDYAESIAFLKGYTASNKSRVIWQPASDGLADLTPEVIEHTDAFDLILKMSLLEQTLKSAQASDSTSRRLQQQLREVERALFGG